MLTASRSPGQSNTDNRTSGMDSNSFKSKAVGTSLSHGFAFTFPVLFQFGLYKSDASQGRIADQSDVLLSAEAVGMEVAPGGKGGIPGPSAKAGQNATSITKAKTSFFMVQLLGGLIAQPKSRFLLSTPEAKKNH